MRTHLKRKKVSLDGKLMLWLGIFTLFIGICSFNQTEIKLGLAILGICIGALALVIGLVEILEELLN